MSLESCICQLEGFESADLQVKIQLPNDFKSDSMIMMFKLRTTTDVLIGPSLMCFLKVLPADQYQGPTKRPNEAELIVMGQSLSEEGYGELRRCLNVIDTLKGNVEEAKKVLNQIYQTEMQLEKWSSYSDTCDIYVLDQ